MKNIEANNAAAYNLDSYPEHCDNVNCLCLLHNLVAAQRKLPTLDFESSACLSDDEHVLHVRESGTEAILRAANFILALSSFAGM